jgi:hypothetical protein
MSDEPSGIPDDPTAGEASEEEIRAAIEEQLRKLRVEDVILQSVATLMSLAGRRLGLAPGAEDERDLGQARLAIEGARALAGLVPEPDAAPIREALSQIQLAFAREAKGAEAPASEEAGTAAEQSPSSSDTGQPGSPGSAEEDAERAKARSKIWTPPGS